MSVNIMASIVQIASNDLDYNTINISLSICIQGASAKTWRYIKMFIKQSW